jgi:hypothetical protein
MRAAPTPDPRWSDLVVASATRTEGMTLLDVLDELRVHGFSSDFFAEPDRVVLCAACDARFESTNLQILDLVRLDGVSDPDDALLVVATTCPTCAVMGTLVLGFGPMASFTDADVLAALALLGPEPR